tara:strand:- start:9398 stop:10012 length:615 start_codon:yes stop_codon:yes gene_type:complete
MAKMDKDDLKSVIKKSRKLFKGEELPKVHGYEGEVEELVIRQPGEIWTDKDGKEWKQIGSSTKVRTETMMDKVRKSLRQCPACNKDIDQTYLNKRMMAIRGMCFDCVQEFEAKLKKEGKYEDYEKKTLLENERSFLVETRVKLVESKEHIASNPEFMNEDGSFEQWNLPNKDKILEDLNSDLEELEKRLSEVESELIPFEGMKF